MSFAPLKFKSMKELEDYYYDTIAKTSSGNILLKANQPILSNTAGWLNAIFGRKVWSQLNMECNAFAMIAKEPWPQSGIRFKTARAYSNAAAGTQQANGTGGQNAEGLSQLPDTLQPGYFQTKIMPKTIWHGFNVSELGEFLTTVDDAIDILPQERQDIGEFHQYQMNHMLFTGVNTAAGDNLESIDRICSNAVIETASGWVSALSLHNIWQLYGARGTTGLVRAAANTSDTTNNAWAEACVVAGSNNTQAGSQTLTTALIDNAFQQVLARGGKTKVILTGYNTLMRWQQLLEAERRFMDTAKVIPTYGGVQGVGPGQEGGFLVATYNQIPIIPSQAADDADDVAGTSLANIWLLDTDYVTIRVAKPTRYLECRDVFALNNLMIEGAYETLGELMCTYFGAQGKVRDLI
jgi:hypothetical protein